MTKVAAACLDTFNSGLEDKNLYENKMNSLSKKHLNWEVQKNFDGQRLVEYWLEILFYFGPKHALFDFEES